MLAVLAAIALALSCAPSALAAETGQITGVVTNTSFAPIAGIEVCAFSPSAEGFACATTEASGKYTIAGLVSGTYEVEFSSPFNSKLNYITQYYNGKSSFSEATPVSVKAGEITSEINARLKEGGWIEGKVTNTSLAPIEGIEVCAFSESPEGFRCAKTSSSGEYTIVGLATGTYKVEFFSPFASPLNYLTQYFNGKALSSEANTVLVKVGEMTSGINAALEEGGRISGRVTDASTGAALKGVLVCARVESGESSLRPCAITSSSGEYTISAVASGSYTVVFNAGKSYVIQYYNGKSSSSEANTVSVTAGSTTSGINAAMQTVGTPPVNTTPPVVSGTPAVGGALMCAPGLWTGKPTPAFTYQWLRDGAPIAGASATSYAVQSADAGHGLSCLVTAKNTKGEKSATSAAVAIQANPPPPPLPPMVTITAIIKARSPKSPVLVRIRCSDAACRGSAELTMQVVTKHRKGKRTVSRRKTLVLAKGAYSLAAGNSGTVVLRLTAAGRKRFAHATKRHPVAAKLTLSVQGGTTTTKPVRVR